MCEWTCWSYPDPVEDCPKFKNLLCFFNEKMEVIYVDGEPEPVTRWS